MAFIPVPNTVQCVVRIESGSDFIGTNTIYFEKQVGTVEPEDLNTVADIVTGWWTTHIAPLVTNQMSLQGVYMRDMSAEDSYVAVVESGTPGTLASAMLPSNVTLAMSLRSNRSGRSQRGRVFHMGLAESQVTGNNVLGTPATDLQEGYDELIGAADAEGWTWVIASFVEGGLPRGTAQTTPIVNVTLVNDTVDTMRSRARQ